MAKKVQISNDGKTTWDDLPGSTANFSVNGEEIDDTILGQTFQSNLTGLVDWRVESDGIFKGFAGYLASIKKQGTATTMTAEACSVESGLIYAIDDGTKDIWDRATGITVLDDASPVAASDILYIDYLFGRVEFITGYTVVGSITVTGKYFPIIAIGKSNSYSLTMTANNIDNSHFAVVQANGGVKTFEPGLRNVALEVQGIFDATESAKTDLTARAELIVEIDPAGDGSSLARGFFRIVNTSQGGAVGALEDETINFALSVPFADDIAVVFNWRHTSTTLAESIQSAITSWLTELNTYDVRYLPSGAIGASPNDGIEGDMMVTDISLSGGLSNMNVFNVTMQGTGAFTVV
ncbi:MAG: hypothetical protein COA78_37065 [Blastopirellula sp.]|nr:MAG: hypothetical protein COA78_37065 [Blastopirellula sp.]